MPLGGNHRSLKGVGAAIKGRKPQGLNFQINLVPTIGTFVLILYFNEEATAASHETLVSGDVGGDWVGIIGPVCWGMLSSPGSPSEGAQSTLAAVLHSSCLSGPKASERGEELASRMYLGQCGSEFSHVMLAITLDKRVIVFL